MQVSNFATKAKLGAQIKISINAVGTVIRQRSRHIDGFDVVVAERATMAIHISQKARGIRPLESLSARAAIKKTGFSFFDLS